MDRQVKISTCVIRLILFATLSICQIFLLTHKSTVSEKTRLNIIYNCFAGHLNFQALFSIFFFLFFFFFFYLQYILNGSNTDGSFTVDDSNSYFSPYKILPIAQENKYLGIFSYFIMELYVVCTHMNCLIEAVLLSTLNIQSLCIKSKRFP